MSKKDENLKMTRKYLEESFPGQKINANEVKGLIEDRPEQLFYTFEVNDQYRLALVRALVDEETVYPVLEGKDIAGQMKSHPRAYVVMDKGPTGKGTEVNIR